MAEKKKKETPVLFPRSTVAQWIELFTQVSRRHITTEKALEKVKAARLEDQLVAMQAASVLHERITTAAALVSVCFDAMRFTIIRENMEDRGIENLRVTDVGTAYLTDAVSVSIKKGKRDEALEWLEENKLGNLVQDTVNSSSLAAAIRERLQNKQRVPSTLFTINPSTRVSIKSK